MYNAPYKGVADQLSQYGRYGDSMLVHMNPVEVQMLSRLSPTGQLTRNPATGQPEAFLPFLAPLLGSFLGSSLLTGAGAGILGAAGLSSAAAGAIGSGLATTLATGDLEQGILSGLTGFGLGSAFGAAGDALKTAGTETAKAATTAASAVPEGMANMPFTPPAANLPGAPTLPSAESLMGGSPIDALNLNISDFNPNLSSLSSGMKPFGVPQNLGSLANMAPEQLANLPPSAPTMGERFAAPFKQPGEFFKQLTQPESFLPMYIGESTRLERQAQEAGKSSMKDYEAEQEAQRQKTLGQMSSVFDRVRSAYPGVGYAEGGMVFDNFDLSSLRNASLPVAEDIQLSLRGQYSVPPPTASYSALDVGGEGYMPGVSKEFRYFTDVNPNGPAPGTPGPGTTPGVNDQQPYMGDGNFNFGDFLGNFGRFRGFNQPATQPTSPPVTQPPVTEPDTVDLQDLLSGQFGPINDRLARMESKFGERDAPPPPVTEFDYDRIPQIDYSRFPQYDMSGIEERLAAIESRSVPEFDYSRIPTTQIDFSPIEQRLAAIESRPTPQFDYSRIPTPQIDFSPIEQRLAAIESRPAPQFDMSGLERRLSGLESGIGSLRPQPIDFSPIEQRLAAIEGRAAPQFDINPLMERLNSLESMLSSQRGQSFQPSMNSFSMEDTMSFADGGMTDVDPAASQQTPQQMDDNLLAMTVAAIRGEIENADEVINMFVSQYGAQAFAELRRRVLQEIVPGAQTEGMVQGQGGGQDDMVGGMIGTQRPVAVSPGEYIVPADVVSLAGGGYSGDGAKFFDGLVDDIRQKTMGTTEQVRPYRSGSMS